MKSLIITAAAAALLASAPTAFAQDRDREHDRSGQGAQSQQQGQAGVPAPNNPTWRRGGSPGGPPPQGQQNQFRSQDQNRNRVQDQNRNQVRPQDQNRFQDQNRNRFQDQNRNQFRPQDQNRFQDQNRNRFQDQNRNQFRPQDQNRFRDQDRYRQQDRNQAWRQWQDRRFRDEWRRDFGRNLNAERRFRIGPYHRPPGFYYRRWTYGQFLPFAFFARQFWIGSYWYYGLPAPPPGCEWVRYGDDALLIDVATGEILQVYYNIFY